MARMSELYARMCFSNSLTSPRQPSSQANVRSTTPRFRQNLDAVCRVGTLDDLERNAGKLEHLGRSRRDVIASVRDAALDGRADVVHHSHHRRNHGAVLHIGRRHELRLRGISATGFWPWHRYIEFWCVGQTVPNTNPALMRLSRTGAQREDAHARRTR